MYNGMPFDGQPSFYNQQDAETLLRRRRPGRGFLRPIFAYVIENRVICIFAALFLLGMLAGALLVKRADGETKELLDLVLGSYLEKREVQSFAAIVASSFLSLFSMLIILFFCGFCTISQLIILAVPLFKGLGYGFSIGMLYAQNGISAMQYVLTMFFPSLLLGALLLIWAAKTSFLLSVRLLSMTITPSDKDERIQMRRYCLKYVFFLIFSIIIAFVDAIVVFQYGGAL